MCPGSTSYSGDVGIRGHCIFRFTRLVSVVVALPFLLVLVLNVFSLSLFFGFGGTDCLFTILGLGFAGIDSFFIVLGLGH